MLKIYRKSLKDKNLIQIPKIQNGSWIYLVNPDQKEINFLSKELNIEKGNILDALDPYEVPRLEIDKNYIYIYLRVPEIINKTINTIPVLFIISENIFITVCSQNLNFFNDFINGKINFYTTQKTKLLLQMCLNINKIYKNFLNSIHKKIRTKHKNIKYITDQDIIDFIEDERILNDFITSIMPTNNIYHNLLSKDYLPLFKEDKDLVEDLIFSNTEIIDLCKMNLKSIINIREAYSRILDNRLNKSVKTLTAITIILSLPVLIASIYGMNISLPIQNNPQAFTILFVFMAAISLFILWIFYKKRWL